MICTSNLSRMLNKSEEGLRKKAEVVFRLTLWSNIRETKRGEKIPNRLAILIAKGRDKNLNGIDNYQQELPSTLEQKLRPPK